MAQQNDGFAIGPVGPGTTVANIAGGLYVLAVIGSTAAQLNIVGPDNSTFLAASPAVTTDVFQTPSTYLRGK
jgi:hypothetical protein